MRPRRPSIARAASLPLLLAASQCASIVGIGDLPGGDAGEGVHVDGGLGPHVDSSFPGFDVVTGRDTFRPGFDTGLPGVDSSRPGFDATQPGVDGSQPGMDAPAGSDSLGYPASNLAGMTFDRSVTGPLTLRSDNCMVYTNPDPPMISCYSGNYAPYDIFSVNMPDGAGTAIIYVFTYISIDNQSSLTVSGPNPVILVALGSVDIAGSIDVSADRFDPNVQAIPGERLHGPGAGAFNNAGPQGAGGGSFCGLGGTGAMGTGALAGKSSPGTSYGSANLIPLWGGGPGGGAAIPSGAYGADQVNGNGGGAIQISAAMNITVEPGAFITANGSGGDSPGDESGTGGGSGGAILLEAPSVTIKGILEANGGEGSDPNQDGAAAPNDGGAAADPGNQGGRGSSAAQVNGGDGRVATGAGGESAGFGAGGGGAGWIRINATTAVLSGTITPSIGSACGSQGALP